MLRIICAAALLAAGCLVVHAAEVGGKYEVRGTNPDGSHYSGTAEISRTAKYTCRITWDVGTQSSGICMLNGAAFAAGYTLNDKVGLVIYELRDDGTLDGAWTIADEDGFGTEVLIPQK
jgi:hypothetical protein